LLLKHSIHQSHTMLIKQFTKFMETHIRIIQVELMILLAIPVSPVLNKIFNLLMTLYNLNIMVHF
jgi:hypothetical protein